MMQPSGAVLVLALCCLSPAARATCPVNTQRCACEKPQNPNGMTCEGDVGGEIPAFLSNSYNFQDLTIQNTSITTVQEDAFLNIQTRRITLANNPSLTSMSPGAFNGLEDYIETIIIRNTGLRLIQAGVLTNLRRLRVLQIEGNQILGLAPFISLPKLRYLSLHNNQITDLPNNAFQDLGSTLSTLVLDQNQLSEFRSGLFDNLAGISYLSATQNNLQSLPIGIFSDMVAINILRLSFNQLTSFPQGMLRTTTEIRELHVQNNQLTSIREDLLFYCRDLHTLDLSYNQLSGIMTLNPFRGMSNLQVLRLEHNQIHIVSAQVFEHQEMLAELHLEHNVIASLEHNSMVGLYNLNELHISNNNISTLPFGIFDPLGRIKVMNLSHNVIEKVESDPFLSNRFLEKLDISSNNIRQLRTDWFRRPLPLVELNLAHNYINDIADDTFARLPQLQILLLHNNRIHKPYHDLFKLNTDLRILTLSANPLVSLHVDIFASLLNLEEIHIGFGCLEQLPPMIFNIMNSGPSLQKIHAQYNFIDNINSSSVTGLENALLLDLSYNNISTLEYSTLSNLRQLQALHLNGNPFRCDCGVAWLRTGYVRNIMNLADTVCGPQSDTAGQYVACFPADACPDAEPVSLEAQQLCASGAGPEVGSDVLSDEEQPLFMGEYGSVPTRYSWYDEQFCLPYVEEDGVTPPSLSVQPAEIDAVRVDGTQMLVIWYQMGENTNIEGYRLTVRLVTTNETLVTGILPANSREHFLNDSSILPHSLYQICVNIILKDKTEVNFPEFCVKAKTLDAASTYGDFEIGTDLPILFIIIASSVAGFVIIMIIILIVVCAFKIQNPKEQPSNQPEKRYDITPFHYSTDTLEQVGEQNVIDWDLGTIPGYKSSKNNKGSPKGSGSGSSGTTGTDVTGSARSTTQLA